jgi:hypothetical protein
MSYSLANLPAYTDQLEVQDGLVHAVVAENRIVKGQNCRIQLGVKAPTTINRMSTDLEWQLNSCGNGSLYAGSGSLSLDQRTLTPATLMAGQIFCPEQLDPYYQSYFLKPGSYQEEIPFEADFTSYFIALQQFQTEQYLFNAQTGSLTNNLSYGNGWLYNISSSGYGGAGSTTGYLTGSVHYSSSGAGVPAQWSGTGSIAIVNAVYQAIPAALKQSIEKPKIYVSQTFYDSYILALQQTYPLSLFNFPENDGELTVPGTQVKVAAFAGLEYSAGNLNYAIFAAQPSNIVYGTDLAEDSAEIKWIYNPYADQVQFKSKFKIAANVAKPYEIVYMDKTF